MKTQMIFGLLSTALLCSAASADCAYPRAPSSTPDGMTATQEEMVAGMKDVNEYTEKVNEYLACLEKETAERIEAAGPDAPAEKIEQMKSIHAKRHNAAFEELTAHVDRFNEQVRAFKERDED